MRPKMKLLDHVWDSEADPFSGTVKCHIHTLKKKLGAGLYAKRANPIPLNGCLRKRTF